MCRPSAINVSMSHTFFFLFFFLSFFLLFFFFFFSIAKEREERAGEGQNK